MQPENPHQRIPRDLHSEYEERPFAHCTRCGESLSDLQHTFQISKAYKRGECVMEYALCYHCMDRMMEEFSMESKTRLSQFQEEKVNPDQGLTICSICGVARNEAGREDFVLTGLCHGEALLHSIMICGECSDGIQEIISAKTRDTWRGFVNDNFPGPPSEGEIPEYDSHPTVISSTGTKP